MMTRNSVTRYGCPSRAWLRDEAFAGSMEAIEALEAAQQIELLITRTAFPVGTPN